MPAGTPTSRPSSLILAGAQTGRPLLLVSAGAQKGSLLYSMPVEAQIAILGPCGEVSGWQVIALNACWSLDGQAIDLDTSRNKSEGQVIILDAFEISDWQAVILDAYESSIRQAIIPDACKSSVGQAVIANTGREVSRQRIIIIVTTCGDKTES